VAITPESAKGARELSRNARANYELRFVRFSVASSTVSATSCRNIGGWRDDEGATMVFTVNIPDRRGITAEQRERLSKLGDDVLTIDGERGRYRPVEVGDALLVSVNADSEADAELLVAHIVGRKPTQLVATARDWVKPAVASVTAAQGTVAPRGAARTSGSPGNGADGDDNRAKTVGAIIRSRRESRGISLRAFARQCDLSPAHVSKIERGLASPSLDTLTRIVKELDLYGANLFGRPEHPGGQPQVIRAADTPVMPGENGGEVRVAAQTAAATVLLGSGGGDEFPSPTISPRQVITVVLAGAIEVLVGDELVELQAGDTLVVPSNVPHSIRVTGGPDTRTAYITSDEVQPSLEAANAA
jgi:transcriptional regulator with XRE-family HTH domain